MVVRYVYARTGKKHRKFEGMRSVSKEIVVVDSLPHTKGAQSNVKGTHHKAIRGGAGARGRWRRRKTQRTIKCHNTHHYFDGLIGEEHAKYIAPTKEDAQRWILLQLLSILPAMENKIRSWKELGKRQEHLLKNLAEEDVAYYKKRHVREIAGRIELPKDLLPYEGYILPKYEKLRDPEFRKRFVTEFVDSHNILDKER